MTSSSGSLSNRITLKPAQSFSALAGSVGRLEPRIGKFSYFEKLHKVENSCNEIHNDLRETKKNASQKILKNIQGLRASVKDFDDLDDGWKKELQKFKEKREKNKKMFEIFTTFPSDKNHPREPIKRTKIQNQVINQDIKKLVFSDASSCLGKQFLQLSRRNFGEITSKSNRSDIGEINKASSCLDRNSGISSQMSTGKAIEMKGLIKKVKDVPKLAKQLKVSKKKGKNN